MACGQLGALSAANDDARGRPFLLGDFLCFVSTVLFLKNNPHPCPSFPVLTFLSPFSQWNKSFSCHTNGISPPHSLPSSLVSFPSSTSSLFGGAASGPSKWKALERLNCELMRSKWWFSELHSLPALHSLSLLLKFPSLFLIWRISRPLCLRSRPNKLLISEAVLLYQHQAPQRLSRDNSRLACLISPMTDDTEDS